MEILRNTDIAPYTTFGVPATAEYLAEVKSIEDVQEAAEHLKKEQLDLLILGGGSNILFTRNPQGLVMLNRIDGIEVLSEDDTSVVVKVGAGVVWHELVEYAIAQNWAGIENLALIPGNVGASPMQNIGAYGVEIKSVFEELQAVHLATGEVHSFSNRACEFGYRESVFKRSLKGQYCITHVTYRFQKSPEFKTSYGAIEQELERMKVHELTIRKVADAVINIRRSKLPDPAEIGNAGSFFKNPIVNEELVSELAEKHPLIPSYDVGDGLRKLAAGWLIDQAGWKGFTNDHHGVHKKQALVLVNYGGATGQNIYDLSEKILQDVQSKFGVTLEREVNIV